MKTRSLLNRHPGFTLIEMLVTITIIVALAGLSLGGFRFIESKKANTQAEIQIRLLEKAIEDYKFDNGVYPSSDTGTSGSNSLYLALYYDGAQDPPLNEGKIYLPQLDPENNKQGWTLGEEADVVLVDPWGNEYIYRTSENIEAVNPDFDLLSKGKDGKTDTGGSDSKDDHNNF